MCVLSDFVAHAGKSADHEGQAPGSCQLVLADEICELGRSELAAIFIQQNYEIVSFDCGNQPFAFRRDQALSVSAARLLFQLAHFGWSEAFDAFQVIVNQSGAIAISGFADPNEMQLQTSTLSASRHKRSRS